MARAFLFVLDSFGIGGAPDAAEFGDEGANTFISHKRPRGEKPTGRGCAKVLSTCPT
jgi:hypothetical protein